MSIDFEQVLLQQVYMKNLKVNKLEQTEIELNTEIQRLNKDNKQLISNLKTQNQVNIEQKKKIEKMIKISQEVKNMINSCNGMKPETKEKVLDMFKTCELLINSEDGHQ